MSVSWVHCALSLAARSCAPCVVTFVVHSVVEKLSVWAPRHPRGRCANWQPPTPIATTCVLGRDVLINQLATSCRMEAHGGNICMNPSMHGLQLSQPNPITTKPYTHKPSGRQESNSAVWQNLQALLQLAVINPTKLTTTHSLPPTCIHPHSIKETPRPSALQGHQPQTIAPLQRGLPNQAPHSIKSMTPAGAPNLGALLLGLQHRHHIRLLVQLRHL